MMIDPWYVAHFYVNVILPVLAAQEEQRSDQPATSEAGDGGRDGSC